LYHIHCNVAEKFIIRRHFPVSMVFSDTRRSIFLAIAEASFPSEGEQSPPTHAYGLATELCLDRSTTGRHLGALAEDDLIERTPSSGRRTEYRVTDAGASIVSIVQANTNLLLGNTKRDVLSLIAERDSIHGYALAEALSLQRSNAYHHLSDLEEEGLVRSERDGRTNNYELTTTGSTLAGILCV
jgi:DNA-binding MarR family transcriptional regulator